MHYRARQKSDKRPAAFSRVLNLILAAVSFVLGIVFSLIPGIPGFIFFFLTAALLAAESFRVAQFLDAAELKTRRLWERMRGRKPARAARSRAASGHVRLARPAK